MSDEARLENPSSPEKKLAKQRKTVFLSAAASIAVVVIVFCIAMLLGSGISLERKPVPTRHNHNVLTDQEYAFARDLVRSEIRRDGAIVTSATVTKSYGREIDSNLGYSCTSGRLLHIKLIGDFPHIVTTGHPVQPGAPIPNFTVHAVVLTADAQTGRACLVGVQTGEVAPSPGAVSLPIG